MVDRLVVEALVDIRLSLADAVRQTGSPLPNDRIRAVVALDAAVERTAFFAAHHRGVAFTSRTSLPDLINAVAKDLTGIWRFNQRQEINRLHSARNKAQHEGLFPAQEHMASFRTATETFVRTLTTAVTGLDASSVVLSSAIGDEELRATLQAAADLEGAGADPLAVVHKCRTAYDLVHRKWSDQTRAAGLDADRSFGYGVGFQEFREIADHARQLERRLRDSVDAALFSVNPGEQVWFKHLTSDARRGDVHISRDEASRALSFVFGWTLRWEQLAELIEQDRGQLAMVMRRNPRATPEESPRILSVDVSSHGGDSAVLLVVLHGVPDVDQFDEWSEGLQTMLTERRSVVPGVVLHWSVLGDGQVQAVFYPMQIESRSGITTTGYDPFRVSEPPPVPESAVATAIELLIESLGEVEADIAARQAAKHAEMRRDEEEDQEFALAIEGRLPDWVERLEIDHSLGNLHGRSRAEVRPYLVRVAHELDDQQVAHTLQGVPGVLQFHSTLDQAFSYVTNADDPIGPLASATSLLRDALNEREERMRPMREWLASAQRAAESAARREG